jgi:hypothetical protein
MKNAASKSFLVILLAVLAAGSASAQQWFNSYAHAVDGDTLFVNAGVGFGPTGGYSSGVPPVSASVDYKLPIGLPITAGLIATYSTWKWKHNLGSLGKVDVTYSNFGIGARGMYHFNFTEKLDTYAGLTLGWVIQSSKSQTSGSVGNYESSNDGEPFFLFGASLGARYFFTSFLGAYLELGYSGLQILGAGLTVKL